ncbi:AAA family ATPase [Kitasatospora sp. NPDC096204]|uniref:AAA family ATPase n=1 Tax=Kitasatospora sp. NPDC096204 TaxID=3364094 RepID=UPI00382A4B69
MAKQDSRRGTVKWGRALASIAGATLVLSGIPGRAAIAAETDWSNIAGPSRGFSAIAKVTVGGNTFEVVRGTDNGVWFRYNGGDFRPLGAGHSQTVDEPAIVQLQDRIVVSHRGLDGQIYYSFLQSPSANMWTQWARVPGDAWSVSGPSMVAIGPDLYVDVVQQDEQMADIALRFDSNGNINSASSWTKPYRSPILLVGPPGVGKTSLAHSIGHAVTRPITRMSLSGQTEIRDYFVGTDKAVYVGARAGQISKGAQKVPGGGLCDSGVSAARLGYQDYTVGPGHPMYNQQLQTLLSCIGTDGLVWTNSSSDGGDTWHGWQHPSGTPAVSTSTPSISATQSSFQITIRWDGTKSAQYPDNTEVGKRVNP